MFPIIIACSSSPLTHFQTIRALPSITTTSSRRHHLYTHHPPSDWQLVVRFSAIEDGACSTYPNRRHSRGQSTVRLFLQSSLTPLGVFIIILIIPYSSIANTSSLRDRHYTHHHSQGSSLNYHYLLSASSSLYTSSSIRLATGRESQCHRRWCLLDLPQLKAQPRPVDSPTSSRRHHHYAHHRHPLSHLLSRQS